MAVITAEQQQEMEIMRSQAAQGMISQQSLLQAELQLQNYANSGSSDSGIVVATEFKPDFNQPNPYAGMPEDYAQKVLDNYVPTESHPVVPYAGQNTGIGRTVYSITGTPTTKIEAEKQIAQIQALVKSGNVITSYDKDGNINYIKADVVREIDSTDKGLANVLRTEGLSSFNKAVEKYWDENAKKKSVYLQYLEEQKEKEKAEQTTLDTKNQERKDAIRDLVNSGFAKKNDDGSYNIDVIKYIQNVKDINPNYQDLLLKAGLSNSDIRNYIIKEQQLSGDKVYLESKVIDSFYDLQTKQFEKDLSNLEIQNKLTPETYKEYQKWSKEHPYVKNIENVKENTQKITSPKTGAITVPNVFNFGLDQKTGWSPKDIVLYDKSKNFAGNVYDFFTKGVQNTNEGQLIGLGLISPTLLAKVPNVVWKATAPIFSGVSGYSTVTNWKDMSTNERVAGVGWTLLPTTMFAPKNMKFPSLREIATNQKGMNVTDLLKPVNTKYVPTQQESLAKLQYQLGTDPYLRTSGLVFERTESGLIIPQKGELSFTAWRERPSNIYPISYELLPKGKIIVPLNEYELLPKQTRVYPSDTIDLSGGSRRPFIDSQKKTSIKTPSKIETTYEIIPKHEFNAPQQKILERIVEPIGSEIELTRTQSDALKNIKNPPSLKSKGIDYNIKDFEDIQRITNERLQVISESQQEARQNQFLKINKNIDVNDTKNLGGQFNETVEGFKSPNFTPTLTKNVPKTQVTSSGSKTHELTKPIPFGGDEFAEVKFSGRPFFVPSISSNGKEVTTPDIVEFTTPDKELSDKNISEFDVDFSNKSGSEVLNINEQIQKINLENKNLNKLNPDIEQLHVPSNVPEIVPENKTVPETKPITEVKVDTSTKTGNKTTTTNRPPPRPPKPPPPISRFKPFILKDKDEKEKVEKKKKRRYLDEYIERVSQKTPELQIHMPTLSNRMDFEVGEMTKRKTGVLIPKSDKIIGSKRKEFVLPEKSYHGIRVGGRSLSVKL